MEYRRGHKSFVFGIGDNLVCHIKNLDPDGEPFSGVEKVYNVSGWMSDKYPIRVTGNSTYAPWELLPYE